MSVGTQCFSLAFYRQKLPFFLESTLNSYYTETNPKLLCAFHTDGSNTGFSSVHRSAVKSEWNALFFFPFLFSSFIFHPATEILPNMLCSTHLGMQIGKRDMMHKTKRKQERNKYESSGRRWQTVSSPVLQGLTWVANWASQAFYETHVKCVSVPLNSC